MTSKQVVKKENNAIAPINMDAWGGSPITSKDIVLPRILMMQPMSDMVTEGDAGFGDMVESLNETKIGDFKNPVEVIPFYLQKVYIEYDVTNGTGDKRFLRMVPITASNDNLPYEDQEDAADGKTFPLMRDRCMNYYVLLPDEVKNGTALPHILTFRRTSLKAGKKLATQMYVKNTDAGLPPPAVMCKLTPTKTSNDKGTFAVLDVSFTGKTPESYITECMRWMKIILAGEAKVDEESYQKEEGSKERNVSAEPENF